MKNCYYKFSFNALADIESKELSAKASLSVSFPVLFPSHVHTIIDPNNRCWTTGSLERTSPEN